MFISTARTTHGCVGEEVYTSKPGSCLLVATCMQTMQLLEPLTLPRGKHSSMAPTSCICTTAHCMCTHTVHSGIAQSGPVQKGSHWHTSGLVRRGGKGRLGEGRGGEGRGGEGREGRGSRGGEGREDGERASILINEVGAPFSSLTVGAPFSSLTVGAPFSSLTYVLNTFSIPALRFTEDLLAGAASISWFL